MTYIYINVHKSITLLILGFKTWKCAQIDQHPSKYFGTNYQSLKMCLKFSDLFLKNNSFIKCFGGKSLQVPVARRLTRWCQIKFIFSDLLSLYMTLWSSGISHLVTQTTMRSSVRFLIYANLNFKFLNSLEVLWYPGIYRHILTWNNHNHLGLVGVGVGLLTVRFSVRSHVGRIAGLDQPREASWSGSG